jgi:hypothetical protein
MFQDYYQEDARNYQKMTRRLGATHMPWIKDVFPESAGKG